jgi:hypothetical protein
MLDAHFLVLFGLGFLSAWEYQDGNKLLPLFFLLVAILYTFTLETS